MTFRYILIAIELLLLLVFLAAFPILCAGNAAGIAFSLVLLFLTFKPDILKKLWAKAAGKAVIITASVLLVIGIIYAAVLSVRMYRAQENHPDDPELIVVLGCKVNGERPSKMLRRRLDTAYDALIKHPKAICVVSGGKGSNEKISEALAMKNYLVEKGIDESRIVMEDKSASTFENIKFTFEITDKMGLGRDITIVTDGFHQYRASLIAKAQGAGEVTAYSAYTEKRFIPTYWVREWLGLTYFFIFGE